jgi:hypothetical protein
MSLRLQRIKTRLNLVNPKGPWKWTDDCTYVYAEVEVGALRTKQKVLDDDKWIVRKENKEFIANSWTDVRDMAEVIEMIESYVALKDHSEDKELVDAKYKELKDILKKFKRG